MGRRQASDDPPAFPAPRWQPNVQGDPHNVGVEGPYFRSNGNSGNGDWFYLEAVMTTILHEEVTHNVEHPAVTCPEEPTSTPPIVTEPPVTETPSPTTPQETVTVESDPIYIPDDQPKKDVPDVRKPSSGRPLPNTGA